jgi:hypothetical protein
MGSFLEYAQRDEQIQAGVQAQEAAAAQQTSLDRNIDRGSQVAEGAREKFRSLGERVKGGLGKLGLAGLGMVANGIDKLKPSAVKEKFESWKNVHEAKVEKARTDRTERWNQRKEQVMSTINTTKDGIRRFINDQKIDTRFTNLKELVNDQREAFSQKMDADEAANHEQIQNALDRKDYVMVAQLSQRAEELRSDRRMAIAEAMTAFDQEVARLEQRYQALKARVGSGSQPLGQPQMQAA